MWLARRSGSMAAVKAIIENWGTSRKPIVSVVPVHWPISAKPPRNPDDNTCDDGCIQVFVLRQAQTQVTPFGLHERVLLTRPSIIGRKAGTARRGVAGDVVRHVGPRQRFPATD